MAKRLDRYPWQRGAQRELFERVKAISLGDDAPPGHWDAEPALDAVRLRLLRSRARRGRGAVGKLEIEWANFFRWAGRRIGDDPEHGSDRLIPVCGTSVAAAHGYARAWDYVEPRLADAGYPLDHFDFMAALALRCGVEGNFRPGHVTWLVPWDRLRTDRRPDEADPWRFAVTALRTYREKGAVAGVVRLTAAMVAADVRDRLRRVLGRTAAAQWLRRRWMSDAGGSSSPVLEHAVEAVRSSAPGAFTRDHPQLWEEPPAPLGPRGTRHRGRSRTATGAPWGLRSSRHGGVPRRPPRRIGHLRVFRLPPQRPGAVGVGEGATPAQRGRRGSAPGDRTDVGGAGPARLRAMEWTRGAPPARKIVREPDLNVVLGTPFWAIAEHRGALLSRLMNEGRVEEARAVRTLLSRRDVQDLVKPFWLLNDCPPDRDAASRLAVHLAAQQTTAVSRQDCFRFVESLCREIHTNPSIGGE